MWREPGKGDGGDVDRRQVDNIGAAAGIARLFGQVMLLPLVTFVYAVESFAKALWEIRHTSDRTLDAFTLSVVQPFDQPNAPSEFGDGPSNSGAIDYAALNVSAGAVNLSNQTTEQPTETEEREMTEQDLRGDDLKLVRWTISFTKRDKEVALDSGLELVDYSTTPGDYQGSKRSEFVEDTLKKEGIPRPQKWIDEAYPADEYLDPNDKKIVKDLPPDDKERFLRVFVEVLTRYEKQDAEYKKVKIVT